RQTDAADNTSDATSLTLTLDTTVAAPSLALAQDSNYDSDGITNEATVNVIGLESDATWQYSINGGSWTDGVGSSFELSDEGSFSIQVRQTDVAGNTSSSAGSYSFVLDTTVPDDPSMQLAVNSGNTSDSTTNNGTVN